jgi:dTDP-4-amino-4,6-dideoxygalactose transaminase
VNQEVSEVLMSAVTIPDMARIVVEHGLIPVPVDLDLATLAPSTEALEAAITPKARAIVVAHLFGIRAQLDRLVQLAHARRLFVIEDLAQGFAGWPEPVASLADASVYSFGPIKSATAVGGGLACSNSLAIIARMRSLQSCHPQQSRMAMAQRLLKYSLLHAASQRPVFDLVVGSMRLFGQDFDRRFAELVRGFPVSSLFDKLRIRPSPALVRLLLRRVQHFDHAQLARRAELAQPRRSLPAIRRSTHFSSRRKEVSGSETATWTDATTS